MDKKTDLRIQRTQKAIIDTFYELLEEKHFSSITIIDICDRALINRGTFYTHFQDKYQLLEKCVYDMMMALDEEVDRVHGDSDMVVYYNDMFDVAIAFLESNRRRIKTIITKADSNLVFNKVHEIIKQNIMKKVGRLPSKTRVPLEVLAEFFAGGLIQVVKWWLTEDPIYPAEQIKLHLYNLVKNTLKFYYVVD
jgi:AcrR family transcriptional regulator